MAVSLSRLSWWLWGGSKEKKHVVDDNSSSEWSFSLKESESLKFPSVKGTDKRKVKKKWRSREEKRVDRECDVVLVSSDGGGGCLSGSESDDSDWSIGWLEPHGSDFQSDDESDSSFAVLVPCYKPGCKEVEGSNNHLLTAIKNLPNEFSSAGNNYMEQWLASLQKI
ncbi:uncharacterized protein LOC131646121 [Vicia villosa]|uniref:uncharacterized protein LOC131646121 n=1 Tax=Vicia villosa TaxID=3911 RepID=UPI00273B4D51|nr:uncharacterized protein LOC131646121 [Vicia villosa]